MPSLRQFLQPFHSQADLKNKFKALIKKSSSSLLYTKLPSPFTLSPSDLPSGSFRSFPFESPKFSSRTSETGDSGKPLSASEALSRVFATPSVHGPVLQSFGYSAYQVLLDENRTPRSSPLSPSSLQCRESSGQSHKSIASSYISSTNFHSECVHSMTVRFSTMSGESVTPSWEKNRLDLVLHQEMQLGMEGILKLDWRYDFEESEEKDDAEECKVDLYDSIQLYEPECATFKLLYGHAYLSSLNDLIQNTVCCINYGVNALKQLELLLNFSPQDVLSLIPRKASSRSLCNRSLKLLSGACYFPHPDKEFTGGEDAHFICSDKQVIGVADGVGGWADIGVDAGEYARQLMSESLIAAQEEPRGCVDAARVLKKAHSKTTCRGSSTACILALSDYGLQAINLGDSGFVVLRNGHTIFKSPVQQHNFNLPYQLESCGGDPISAAELFVIDVAEGDVIIAGTDGLFDNLYATEMASIVMQCKISGHSPDITAQRIAYTAREHAKDRYRETPFSVAAQNAGFHFYGGKMDDITVVVSYVTDSTFNCDL